MKTIEELKQDVRESAIDKLKDGIGEGYASELNQRLFNEDYFIIGTYAAKEWLGDGVFDAIETIREYEQDNFGEVHTDFSNPEKVANMLAYVLGEQLLAESETLQDNWNGTLDGSDLLKIASEL